ncbi:MAG: hypothetical protein EA378_09475 [Phycisphaerales bacterium]|nr:MAG: hypothetical protein EA378_09475 [Phycisphaerales bacterium]
MTSPGTSLLRAGEPIAVGPVVGAGAGGLFSDGDFLAIPACRGVVVLEAADGRAVLAGVTGDARRFCRARLDESPPDAGPGGRPKADLRPVTARVLVYPAASMLAGEAMFLEIARERLPRVARLASERRRGWFVRWNADDPTPTWRKTNLSDVGSGSTNGSTDGSDLLGPFGTKDAGGRFAEGLDELFELCRYPRELEKAPRGKACAYKEMGKCPAACDGSERMASYRERVRAGVDLTREGVPAAIERTTVELRSASAAMDFERAAVLKARLDRLGAMGKAPMRHARTLDRFAALAAGPGERGADVLLCVRGWVYALGELCEASEAAAMAGGVREACADAPKFDGEAARVEAVGLFAHWLYGAAKSRDRAVLVPDDDRGGDGIERTLAALAGEVCKRAQASGDEDDGPDAGGLEVRDG